jgi:hypothetical protein
MLILMTHDLSHCGLHMPSPERFADNQIVRQSQAHFVAPTGDEDDGNPSAEQIVCTASIPDPRRQLHICRDQLGRSFGGCGNRIVERYRYRERTEVAVPQDVLNGYGDQFVVFDNCCEAVVRTRWWVRTCSDMAVVD